ncbi:MAG TPA: hypothetical protein ENO00_11875 [Deltaproteobacteria bacterium]|nr:hypothetical protein [Deltaproteobacteria bacterium]
MVSVISISRADFIEKLNDIAAAVEEEYGVSLRFVEILSRRRSFIAGCENDISCSPPERIEINERFGIVSDRWNDMPLTVQDAILRQLAEIVTAYEQR